MPKSIGAFPEAQNGLVKAIADPSGFCDKLVTASATDKLLCRRGLAELSMACLLLGIRKNLEVDSDQLLFDIVNCEAVDQALVTLEFLYACRRLELLSNIFSSLCSEWLDDIRIVDLHMRVRRGIEKGRFSLSPNSLNLNFGILDFSYRGFDHFSDEFELDGQYSINLGDFIQSDAVRRALIDLGVDAKNIHYVDRDDLDSYSGPVVYLIMNGVFFPKSFPFSNNIYPIWFGLSLHPDNLLSGETEVDFKKALLEIPTSISIGCRDEATAKVLSEHGIDTFVSGCLSQSLSSDNFDRNLLRTVVCGVSDLRLINKLRDFSSDLIFLPDQRRFVNRFPLSKSDRLECREAARALLDFYRHHAGRVITSLLHCAGPCAAMGVPSVVVRKDPENIRFTSLSRHLSILDEEEAIEDVERLVFKTIDLRNFQLDLLEATIELNLLCQS